MPRPEPSVAAGRDTALVRLILILAVCGFASSLTTRSLDPLIGVLARDFAAEPHSVALLATAFALPYAFIQPILGPIGDALGKERVMIVCLGLLGAALAASAFAPNLPVLFGLRVVSGAAAGGVIPLVLATIGDRVEMARRQVAIARFMVAIVVGNLSGGSFPGIAAGWMGWRGVVLTTAVIALAACAAAAAAFRGTGRASGAFDPVVAVDRYRRVIANPKARSLYTFVFIEGLAILGVFPFIAVLLEDRGLGGPLEAGLTIASFAVGGLVYSVLVSWLLRVLGLGRMLAAAGLIAAAAYLGLILAGHWLVAAAGMLGLGLAFYMLHSSFQTQVTEILAEARASAVSLHAFAFFCGQALGPVVLGAGLAGVGVAATFGACGIAILALGHIAAKLLAPHPAAQPRPR